MPKAQPHKISYRATLLLLAGLSVFVGCISIPDMGPLVQHTVGQPLSTSVEFASAASVYYGCCGKWPATVDDLRSLECKDAEKRQEMSNILATVPWNALTNQVTFETMPDGKLKISMSFIGGTFTANGSSMSWNGGSVITTVGISKSPQEGVHIETLDIQESPRK